MNTGAPKDYMNMNVPGLDVRSSLDFCKGCRSCCNSLIKTIGESRVATSLVICLPMIAMMAFLIYLETTFYMYLHSIPSFQAYLPYKATLFTPIYTLAGITFAFGLLALASIRCEFQNMLRFSAFVYRGIAHWVLLSIFLIIFPVAGYMPLAILFQILCWAAIPACLWLFTAAVMSGHGELISNAIEARNRVATSRSPYVVEERIG